MPTERKILIIEDDAPWSEILCAVLTMRGWKPVVAGSLSHGKKALGEVGAEAVILDLKLPDSDAMSTLDEIPNLRLLHRGPIVVLTGWPITPELETLAKAAGATSVLAKDAPQFRERVDAALRA